MKHFSRIAVSFLFVIIAALLSACVSPVTPTTPTPDPAQDWQRIEERGELRVGVSADYPPFEYYDDRFRITGFDPELIREIGARLGLEVQVKDIPFDGLTNALLLNQVDVIISALSITPERSLSVDFTDAYYVGEDAFLVPAVGDATLYRSLEEVAETTRVGVQRGSVYQTWVEEELVEPGLLPQNNLQLYTDIKRAVTDLAARRIDLVIMDALPAQHFAATGDVVVAAQGLNRQRYAMAVRKGSDQLRRRLNAALDELRNDGVLTELALKHLGLGADDIPPVATPTAASTPTPTPTATRPAATVTPTATPRAVATPGCTDGMAYVADLTYDDKNMTAPPVLMPGQAFAKGWRVRNSGTCTWDGRYRLAYAYGNVPEARMGGQPVPVVGHVLPGATYDFYVNLVAPLKPGVYQGFWRMVNAQNTPFGQRIYVGIRVQSPATTTPRPTPTPTTQISFSASPTSIRAGQSVVFTWSVQNAREVYFFSQGQNWWEHPAPLSATRTEFPQQTLTYSLRVVKPNNAVEVRQITIFVEQVQGAPVIALFLVSPEGQISLGQCVRIDWDVQGNVSRVDLRRNGGDLWDNAPWRGSLGDCPPIAGSYEYRLDAFGPGGQSRAVRFVTVVQPPATLTATPTASRTPTPPATAPSTPTPTVTASPSPTAVATASPTATQPPTETPTVTPILPVVIDYFAVEPSQIELGQCLTISWSVRGDAGLIQIKRNGAVVLNFAPPGGNLPDCPGVAGEYLYRIEANGRDGQSSDARETTARVTEPLPPTATPTTTPTVTPTATPTRAPVAPVIDYFDLSADVIAEGECVMLSWGYHGQDLAASRIERNGEVIAVDPPLTGQQNDCPPATGQYTYTLIVTAEFGGLTQQARLLTVEPPLEAAPLPGQP